MEALSYIQSSEPAAVVAGLPSILFPGADPDLPALEQPEFFADLNLDRVVSAIVAGSEAYDLEPFFYAPLRSVAAVEYRHEVCRELEREDVGEAVRAFAGGMQRVRTFLGLAETLRYVHERERWFLDAASLYCAAVRDLAAALARLRLDSRGLRALRDYVAAEASSDAFLSFADEARRVRDALASVRYSVRIKGLRVTVGPYGGEPDYSAEVARDFERFRQGDVEAHRFKVPDSGSMDHVEAQIAARVALLFPDAFRALDELCARHAGFVDPVLARFEREAQFYLAYLAHVRRLREAGLPFCYPSVSSSSKDVSATDAFDLALARKLVGEGAPLVVNDFFLEGAERMLVVTGPNQGGKTTFARMFGQLHYLASLGLPVPAGEARLFLADALYTHFEREEDITTLRGKLDDELVRIHAILERATGDSIVLLNEMFASTTLRDSIDLGTKVLEQLLALGSLGVCVTFVDELASLGEATVSMVATVEPDNPATRTHRIVRRPADGRAYAWAIAEKYGLTHDRLARRVAR